MSATGFQRGRPAVALHSYTYLSLAEDEWPRSIRETEGEQDSERNGRRGLLPDGAYNVANLCLLVCASVSEKSSWQEHNSLLWLDHSDSGSSFTAALLIKSTNLNDYWCYGNTRFSLSCHCLVLCFSLSACFLSIFVDRTLKIGVKWHRLKFTHV